MPFTATWIDLEIIILNEVGERQIYDSTYMWNLKNDTDELTYKTETDSQTQKTNLWLPKEKRVGRDKLGVWDQRIHTTICKIGKQQHPTIYSTGNYIQYFVINYNGKEYEK